VTILYPKRFEEAAAAGFDGIFDWDFLLPAFEPTKIAPMDWDAVIERRGSFLVFETKQPGASIPDGQRYALEAAVRTGNFTIIILFAKTALDICGWEVWFLINDRVVKKQLRGNSKELTSFVRRWFLKASGEIAA